MKNLITTITLLFSVVIFGQDNPLATPNGIRVTNVEEKSVNDSIRIAVFDENNILKYWVNKDSLGGSGGLQDLQSVMEEGSFSVLTEEGNMLMLRQVGQNNASIATEVTNLQSVVGVHSSRDMQGDLWGANINLTTSEIGEANASIGITSQQVLNRGIHFTKNNGSYVVDDIGSEGLKYQEDYSANGTLNDRWIPDYGAVKDYVDTSIPDLSNYLQSGDNVSELDNDVGYITSTDVPENIGDLNDVENYTAPNQFAVSNSTGDGVEFRNILPADVNLGLTSEGIRVLTINNTGNFTQRNGRETPLGGSIAIRTSNGQLNVNPADIPSHAVPLGQLEEILGDYPDIATPRSLASRYKQENVINNAAMEEHGSYPTAVKTQTGDVYVASIDDEAWLYITKTTRGGKNYSRNLGRVRALIGSHHETDSHACPQVLLDERPDAEYPIIVFQTDHGTGSTQYWRFNTFDIEYAEIPEAEIVPGTGPLGNMMSYGMLYRYEDKIWLINRPVTSVGVGYRSRWRIAVSEDNGDTWKQRDIFNSTPSTGTTGQYCTSTQVDNTPLVNIVFVSASQTIGNKESRLLQLNLETNELTNLNGFIIADIIDYIENETTYINPFEDGLLLYSSAGAILRPQISQNENGNLWCILLQRDSGEYYGIEFDRVNGAIISTNLLYTITEGYSDQQHLLFVNDETQYILVFEYRNDYNNDDIRLSYGEGKITKVDFSDLNDIQEEIIIRGSYRLGRAEVLNDYKGFVFSERYWDPTGSSYIRWRSNVIIHHFEEERSAYPKESNTTYSAGSGITLTGTTFTVDNTVFRTTGNQSAGGIKTFTSSPIVPDGTLAGHAVNLGQLNTAISTKSNYSIQTIVGNNQLIEVNTSKTLVLVSDLTSTVVRLPPATSNNTGASVIVKVSGMSSSVSSETGSKIVDFENNLEDDIAISSNAAEFISDGANWQLVTVLR